MFTTNEGTADRVVRILIGLFALGLFFFGPAWGMRWLLLVGLVPLVTGLVGWCPLYAVLGVSTCPARRA
jgi:hypothetical protein